MWRYTTLRNEVINLDEITPEELIILRQLLDVCGGPEFPHVPLNDAQETAYREAAKRLEALAAGPERDLPATFCIEIPREAAVKRRGRRGIAGLPPPRLNSDLLTVTARSRDQAKKGAAYYRDCCEQRSAMRMGRKPGRHRIEDFLLSARVLIHRDLQNYEQTRRIRTTRLHHHRPRKPT